MFYFLQACFWVPAELPKHCAQSEHSPVPDAAAHCVISVWRIKPQDLQRTDQYVSCTVCSIIMVVLCIILILDSIISPSIPDEAFPLSGMGYCEWRKRERKQIQWDSSNSPQVCYIMFKFKGNFLKWWCLRLCCY